MYNIFLCHLWWCIPGGDAKLAGGQLRYAYDIVSPFIFFKFKSVNILSFCVAFENQFKKGESYCRKKLVKDSQDSFLTAYWDPLLRSVLVWSG